MLVAAVKKVIVIILVKVDCKLQGMCKPPCKIACVVSMQRDIRFEPNRTLLIGIADVICLPVMIVCSMRHIHYTRTYLVVLLYILLYMAKLGIYRVYTVY